MLWFSINNSRLDGCGLFVYWNPDCRCPLLPKSWHPPFSGILPLDVSSPAVGDILRSGRSRELRACRVRVQVFDGAYRSFQSAIWGHSDPLSVNSWVSIKVFVVLLSTDLYSLLSVKEFVVSRIVVLINLQEPSLRPPPLRALDKLREKTFVCTSTNSKFVQFVVRPEGIRIRESGNFVSCRSQLFWTQEVGEGSLLRIQSLRNNYDDVRWICMK